MRSLAARLPLLRDRMPTSTTTGDDMDDSYITPDHDDVVAEQPAAVHEQAMLKIRFGTSISPYKRGDEMVVSADDKFFAGLIAQGMVEVIG